MLATASPTRSAPSWASSILLSNYRDDFETVRFVSLAGIATMMGTIAIRSWATYEAPLAAAVTCIFVVRRPSWRPPTADPPWLSLTFFVSRVSPETRVDNVFNG